MKTSTLISAAFLLVFLAHATSASAMCAFARGPRLLEAKIVACEDPRSLAEQRLQKFSSMSGPEAVAPDRFLAANPGRVLTLRVSRFQQLGEEVQGGLRKPTGPWKAVASPKEERYVFLGGESCEDLRKESPRVFLEQMECCDTIPPAGLACLLEMEAVTLPPVK